ncbi:hypothetical protein [Rhizobium alvei]|uniref:Ead/Ea22-like family protein n=1 Tax=Rhizobium alvei TaxID=1132659 RepID=A0ABT8YTB2_9HYPH|nr:hypothetical protein [Rhizobium alvei]MDO6966929.1 hypothetical protein [Rhizobium alvei]
MSDIVERLTMIADACKRPDGSDIPLGLELREAANEITALRSRLEQAEKEREELRITADAVRRVSVKYAKAKTAAEKALADARIEIDAMRKKAIENARERNTAETKLREAVELIRPFGESDIIDLAEFKMLTDSHCIGGYCTDFTIGDLRAAAAFLAKVTP